MSQDNEYACITDNSWDGQVLSRDDAHSNLLSTAEAMADDARSIERMALAFAASGAPVKYDGSYISIGIEMHED